MYCSKNYSTRNKSRYDLLVWVFALGVMVAIATGDVGEPAMYADAGWADEFTDVRTNPGGVPQSGRMIQSFTFEEDMSLRKALKFIAASYKKNVVPSPMVDGILAFTTLIDVTFEEALDAILGYRFKYEQDGGFTRVYTADEYRNIKQDKDRMIHRVFTLYYITAEEVERLVTPVLSDAGLIKGSTAAREGISVGKEGISGAEAGGDSMALHDTIIVYDYPENIAKAEEVIAALDVRPKQVLIEATILSATLTEGMQLGIDLNLLAGVSLTGTTAMGGKADTVLGGFIEGSQTAGLTTLEQIHALKTGQPVQVSGFAAAGGGGLRVGISVGNAVALITALESVTDITILANPKILALNKQVGTVFIGTKLGYRDRTTIDASGLATIGEVKFLDTGTKLSFRPYIGNDGYIRMDIYPKDSSGELDDEGIPTEITAELVTNIMVKDGQTIVIGGLFRDAVTTTRSQVPLLGDIPLIGAAFRGTTDTNVRQEIIVMLTPHIITEPGQTDGDERAADIARKRYGARMGLLGISRARLAEDHYANAVSHYADGNSVEALYELDGALDLRPTYIEALRLKERIIREVSPDEVGQIERIMLGIIEQEEAPRWRRR